MTTCSWGIRDQSLPQIHIICFPGLVVPATTRGKSICLWIWFSLQLPRNSGESRCSSRGRGHCTPSSSRCSRVSRPDLLALEWSWPKSSEHPSLVSWTQPLPTLARRHCSSKRKYPLFRCKPSHRWELFAPLKSFVAIYPLKSSSTSTTPTLHLRNRSSASGIDGASTESPSLSTPTR